ncbi:MAG TPA: hypothetical protein VFF06_02690 [Polyangia bacterium]|nr:hypothetical protein [Polyangia bacterium]
MRVIVGLLALLLAGCGGGASIDLDAGACSVPIIYDASCAKCMETSCCAQIMACAPDTQCQTFLACGSHCSMDQSCLFNCIPNGSSTTPSNMLLSCVAANCRMVCGG